MLFKRTLLCATFALAAGQAHADDCKLKQLASLDVIVKDNDVLIPVTVGGQTGGYFRLSFTHLVSAVADTTADAQHLKRDPVPSQISIGFDGKQVREQVHVPIQMGGVTGDVVMGVIPQYSSDDKRVIGVISTDILERFDVDLYLAHNKLNLFSTDHCAGQVVYWTHENAVGVPMRFQGGQTFVIPMQLDGHDIDASLSTDAIPKLSNQIARDTFGVNDPIPANGPLPRHRFKTLSVDGLTISNPEIEIYDDKYGCNGKARTSEGPLHSSHSVELQTCFGEPDLTLALAELKALHVYIAFKERMLYASGANAH